jgi:hypothetical protein
LLFDKYDVRFIRFIDSFDIDLGEPVFPISGEFYPKCSPCGYYPTVSPYEKKSHLRGTFPLNGIKEEINYREEWKETNVLRAFLSFLCAPWRASLLCLDLAHATALRFRQLRSCTTILYLLLPLSSFSALILFCSYILVSQNSIVISYQEFSRLWKDFRCPRESWRRVKVTFKSEGFYLLSKGLERNNLLAKQKVKVDLY